MFRIQTQVTKVFKLRQASTRLFTQSSVGFRGKDDPSSKSTSVDASLSQEEEKSGETSNPGIEKSPKLKKTSAELDAEAVSRMEERFGGKDTGDLHIVDGKPASIASHVQKNFFRYI